MDKTDVLVRVATDCKEPDKNKYKMTEFRRGHVLIINNMNFEDPTKRRDGSDNDVWSLQQLFKKLYFEVESSTDLTKKEMKEKLTLFAETKDWRHADCAIVVVMTHGTMTYSLDDTLLEGIDELKVKVSKLIKKLTLPALDGKPKIFIIQACRGGSGDGVHDGSDGKNISIKTISKTEPVISKRDVFVAYATPPGTAASRDPTTGSWFIQTLVKVFAQNACKMDLDQLFRKVDSELKMLDETVNINQTGWSKGLFFNPGIYKEEGKVITESEEELNRKPSDIPDSPEPCQTMDEKKSYIVIKVGNGLFEEQLSQSYVTVHSDLLSQSTQTDKMTSPSPVWNEYFIVPFEKKCQLTVKLMYEKVKIKSILHSEIMIPHTRFEWIGHLGTEKSARGKRLRLLYVFRRKNAKPNQFFPEPTRFCVDWLPLPRGAEKASSNTKELVSKCDKVFKRWDVGRYCHFTLYNKNKKEVGSVGIKILELWEKKEKEEKKKSFTSETLTAEDKLAQFISENENIIISDELQVPLLTHRDSPQIHREWRNLCVKDFDRIAGAIGENRLIEKDLKINLYAKKKRLNLYQKLKLLGEICGEMACRGFQLNNVHLTRSFYKMMLGKTLTKLDLKIDYPEVWERINREVDVLLNRKYATFSIPDIENPETMKDLVSNGSKIVLNSHNKHVFVDLCTEYLLDKLFLEKVMAFKEGFDIRVPNESLKIFDECELEFLLCGIPNVNIDDWKRRAKFMGEFRKSDQVSLLWQYLSSSSNPIKAKFVKLIQGPSRFIKPIPHFFIKAAEEQDSRIKTRFSYKEAPILYIPPLENLDDVKKALDDAFSDLDNCWA